MQNVYLNEKENTGGFNNMFREWKTERKGGTETRGIFLKILFPFSHQGGHPQMGMHCPTITRSQ